MAIDLQSESPVSEIQDNGNGAATLTDHDRQDRRPRGQWLKRIAGVLVVAALIAAVGTWILQSFAAEEATDLLTHTIKRGDLLVSVSEEGSLESASNIEIKCRVKGGGTVVEIVEDGTVVAAGDVLVRFDTSVIEESVSQQQIAVENARATLVQSESDHAVAKIALTEYVEGTYQAALKTAEANVALAEANLVTADNILNHSRRMMRKGYQSQLDVDSFAISLQQAQLQLEVYEADLDALVRFTRAKMVEELEAAVKAAEARVASDQATLDLEEGRLERERLQLENCVIVAESGGMVLFAKGRDWEDTPTIDVGAVIYEQKTILVIPDLSRMQVNIDIHESKIDQVEPGMPARIDIQGVTIDGEVDSVASVTRPAGWWNGNEVAYDTIIEFDPEGTGLKPGMSAEVEVFIARHENVLKIPVAAVVEQNQQFHCWVQADGRTQRRDLQLGDSNDQFVVVNEGLSEGDEVVLNPGSFIDQATEDALQPVEESLPAESQDGRVANNDAEQRDGK